MTRILTLLVVFFTLMGCANYDLKSDLTYSKDHPLNTYDAYYPAKQWYSFLLPDDKAPKPVIVAIHGGAWEGGDKHDMHKIADDLCPRGYIVLSINYRLSTAGPWGAASTWPAGIEDCQKAVAYFRQNADWLKINPTHMSSLGISAGGHLATMLSVRPDPHQPGNAPAVKVAVDLDGEQDMTLPGDKCMTEFDDIMSHVSGNTSTDWSDPAKRTAAMNALCKDISTLTWVPTANPKPSVLIIHGAGDSNVFVVNAYELETALKNAGCDVEKVILTGSDGACHGNCWENEPANSRLHAFLDRNLKR